MALIARNGKIVDRVAYGHRDLARTTPIDFETIFRIYSMTKPVATVAVLMLEEEGKLALEDPVARHLPEFAGRTATIHHLLTHTTGFAQASPAVERSRDLAAYSRAASRLPQAAPAGTRFEYNSVNTEVASRLVEAVSGQRFDLFLESRIFTPLGMHDTGFSVPREKRARLAHMTSTDAEGKLVDYPAGESRHPGGMMRSWFSGAGGLYSTAADFARFCQALLDGGQLEGARILTRRSVERMMSNQLGHLDPPVSQYGEGFGLGGFVILDVRESSLPRVGGGPMHREQTELGPALRRGDTRPGSVGAFGWSGAAGTYFMIDPRERLFAVLLTQHLPRGLARDPRKLSFQFYNRVYQSLAK